MNNINNDFTELTVLLNEWRTGDPDLIRDIIPAVYDELHRVAARLMASEMSGHTLQATALINEAWMRMNTVSSEINDRGHFVGIVARLMRNVLVDHARVKNSQKRGGGIDNLSIDDHPVAAPDESRDLLALEEILDKLSIDNPRSVQIAELYYFCGMTLGETAQVADVSESTVRRELTLIKTILREKLSDT